MGKITQNDRINYQHSIRTYKNKIDEIKKAINLIKFDINKDKTIEPIARFKIANMALNLITLNCSLNEISVHLLEVKNSGFLERAREQVYEALINMEKVVTTFLDVPYSEYEEYLEKISNITDLQRLYFIKKLGYCIDLVKENFGENTKWKWSFVEIDGRFAIVAKNLLDLKRYQKLDDPSTEGYEIRREHFKIVQHLLNQASQGYREKFELSTKNSDDLSKAIEFQRALLRLNQLTGDEEKILKCKKCIEVWSTLLEKHLAELEEEKKKKYQIPPQIKK